MHEGERIRWSGARSTFPRWESTLVRSVRRAASRGSTIRLQTRCLDKFIRKSRLFAVHDNVFFNQRDEVICSGRGTTIRPQ
jgi:hypothetical protein